MANITYGTIVGAMDALKKIAESELSMPVLYQVSKLLHQIDDELVFYNKKRQEIVDKYCTKVSDEKYQIDDPENFGREMADLDGIVLDDVRPITIPTTERISLSYNALRSLEGLITILPTEVSHDRS